MADRISFPAAKKSCKKVPAVRDFLSELPVDVTVEYVLDKYLSGFDTEKLPYVCKNWKRMFDQGTPYEDAFRAVIRRRFSISKKPRYVKKKGWGELYLMLRGERCHECSQQDARPGLFAASISFISVLSNDSPYMLFPICERCFHGADITPCSLAPAIDPDVITQKFAYPEALIEKSERIRRKKGVLYNELGKILGGGGSSSTVEIFLRRDLEAVLKRKS